jgi:hypothetical protein
MSKPNSDVASISDRIADQIKTYNNENIKTFLRQVTKEGHTFCPATFKSDANDFEKTRRRKENFEQLQLLAFDYVGVVLHLEPLRIYTYGAEI